MITIYKVSIFEQSCLSDAKTEYFLFSSDAKSFINSISNYTETENIKVWEFDEFGPTISNIKQALSTLTNEEKKELKKNINLFI